MFWADDPDAYRNRGTEVPLSPRTGDPALVMRAWNAAFEGWTAPTGLERPAQVLGNHAGTVSAVAPRVLEPTSEAELAGIVRTAVRERRNVRVVGSRHSYNDCFYSPSALVSLGAFDQIGDIDEERHTITVGAGVTVQALCDHLDARGYALRWAGNSGKQTVVGAAITGTHGYCRDGGLLAELIVGARVVNGRGEILEVDDEAELRALRVSLGTLGIITRAELSIVPASAPVRYALETLEQEEFLSRLCRDARAHAYYRFFPNRYHRERFSVLTIDAFEGEPEEGALSRVGYIDKTVGPRPLVAALRAVLRSSWAHRILRRLPAPRLKMSLVAPFSTLLFVNAGVVDRWHRLAGLIYQAWNDDRTRNMELAVRPEDFRDFLRIFRAVEAEHHRRTGDFGTYFTGRYVGGSERTLIGPNRERDVVFIDVHVGKGPGAERFVRELEARLGEAVEVRPHWGKEFNMETDELEGAYPPGAWAAFCAAKRQHDPENVFSNAYTRRVFGW